MLVIVGGEALLKQVAINLQLMELLQLLLAKSRMTIALAAVRFILMQLAPSIKLVLVQIQKLQDAANGQMKILMVNVGLFGRQKKLQIVEEAAMFSGQELALIHKVLVRVPVVAAAAQAAAVVILPQPVLSIAVCTTTIQPSAMV
jgi:hypothetical protein